MPKALILAARQQLIYREVEPPAITAGLLRLPVLYAAICRTDAKMWHSGHRDLHLPRILGHELALLDPRDGRPATVWPGQACGLCRYCREGRENLCDQMRITGFHHDGGFASWLDAPAGMILPAPAELTRPELLCFAEPIACALHALESVAVEAGEQVVIHGGGVLGLLLALACRDIGALPLVIEHKASKITHTAAFAEAAAVPVVSESHAADFAVAIPACDSAQALAMAIGKLRKGGRLCYFSGLESHAAIQTQILNLLHYREISLRGCYGPARRHLQRALPFISRYQQQLPLLIERLIAPEEAAGCLQQVLRGDTLKFIINFTGSNMTSHKSSPRTSHDLSATPSTFSNDARLQKLVAGITPLDPRQIAAAQTKIDMKTKPLGALGRLERLAVQLSAIQQNEMPCTDRKQLLVFAADHGITDEGVSAYPREVTAQMVLNFLAGGAAINVFCRQYGIDLRVVDMGVASPLAAHPLLLDKKIRAGSRNFAIEPAMTCEETIVALQAGAAAYQECAAQQPCHIIGLGEMGIGNTSAATAIISAATSLAPGQLAGRGTGVDDAGLARKVEVLEKALALHQLNPGDGLSILQKVGGYEIAGMAGAILAAASQRSCVVLDGLISTAAGLIAWLICPTAAAYMVAGHKSVERGQMAALRLMGLEPLLDLDMRLGEGTGAAIAISVVELAARVQREMASFAEAGVSERLE